MAEIIAYDLLKVVLKTLASEAVKKIVRSRGIQSELKKLETKLSEIQEFLNDASQKEVTDKSVKRWLNSLQHLAYDIDDILDGLATDAIKTEFNEEDSVAFTSKVRKHIPTSFTNFSLSEMMSHKLNHITSRLQDLEKEKNALGLVVKDDRPVNVNKRLQTSLVDESSIFGREVEKEALVHKLLADEPCKGNFSIVPIVGMGGVGKTTLARLLYNDKRVKDHFDRKVWVCVSDDFDSISITKVIFQSMVGEKGSPREVVISPEGSTFHEIIKDFADFNLLQVALKNKLTGKRFLLVLDDVWSESYEDWETLVAPFHACAPGSKIIVTTRKEQLLKKLGYNHTEQLHCLSHEEALSLLALHALGVNNFDLHLVLKPHGEDIVEKCGGLPLALMALGRLLRTKGNEEDHWKEVLNNEIWRLKDGGGIVPALRLSYHDLSACLKRLFAYCSLFPKDYIFDKRELVLLWMSEGFLHHSSLEKSTEEHFGDECFEELLSRSFFQHAPNDKTLFVMHDLMNDLATSIAGEFFVRLENEMEKHQGIEELEKYRHMSFAREKYGAYNKFTAFEKARSLRTFLATSIGVINDWQRFYLSNKILVNLLPKMPLLRVLNLSNFKINEVPNTIGSLKHLRYLNLSQTHIIELPENVCKLYNLQTLIVFDCYKLVKLPNNFSMLKNLRHFDIRNTPLPNTMPLGIDKLGNLQTLSKIIIGGRNRFKISDLKELKNLCGEISIEGLDEVENAIDVREAKFSQKMISNLELRWSDDFVFREELLEKKALEELKPRNDTLKQLKLVSYGGKEIPNWVADPSFVRLSNVSIRGCIKCTCLPSLGQLHSLEELSIEGMDKVNNVGLEFFGTGVTFPSLKILRFKNMKGWKSWSTKSRDAFPCLEKLIIRSCPNLVKVSLKSLPSLRNLQIRECDHTLLTSLVHAAPSVTELKVDSISGLTDEVWTGVGKHLRAVEKLSIWYCNEIKYIWESEAKASMVLLSLSKLKVSYCDNLARLGRREDDDTMSGNLLTSLRILEIRYCKHMVRCMCPKNIEILEIKSCDSLKDVSFSSRGGGQKLKSLTIGKCKKVMKKELGGYEGEDQSEMLINKGIPLLHDVSIYNLPDLKFILELNCFLHLTTLKINDCKSLKSFPDKQLPDLTSLTRLQIQKCPRINGSFPRGLWPPKLKYLEIGELKKPISEWSPQNFPSSLVELMLCGGNDEDTSISGRQLYHLLPSSLTSLSIIHFEELETISRGLQHLTSLQHLEIRSCPKMKDLPEMLLPSLLSLRVEGCQKLEKRCSKTRRGFYNYWPLIYHIPKIEI